MDWNQPFTDEEARTRIDTLASSIVLALLFVSSLCAVFLIDIPK